MIIRNLIHSVVSYQVDMEGLASAENYVYKSNQAYFKFKKVDNGCIRASRLWYRDILNADSREVVISYVAKTIFTFQIEIFDKDMWDMLHLMREQEEKNISFIRENSFYYLKYFDNLSYSAWGEPDLQDHMYASLCTEFSASNFWSDK